jgi:cellulose synthase/poly-beta-1,6-N-acetylglucosamine synthase-like glycosyltransferase
MISVVIATLNDERALGETLGALIAAAIDGLVREVIVADGGSTDHTLAIADDAGARILKGDGAAAGRIVEGCAMARGEWLLVLDPQVIPAAGWDSAVKDHVREHADRAAWWSAKPRGLAFWRTPEPQGLLISRRLYDQAGLSPRGARRLKFGKGR